MKSGQSRRFTVLGGGEAGCFALEGNRACSHLRRLCLRPPSTLRQPSKRVIRPNQVEQGWFRHSPALPVVISEPVPSRLLKEVKSEHTPPHRGNLMAHAELAEGRKYLSRNQELSSFQESNKEGQVAKR